MCSHHALTSGFETYSFIGWLRIRHICCFLNTQSCLFLPHWHIGQCLWRNSCALLTLRMGVPLSLTPVLLHKLEHTICDRCPPTNGDIGRRLYRLFHSEFFPYNPFGVSLETDTAVSFTATHLAATRLSCGTIHLAPLHLAKLFPCLCLAPRPGRGVFEVRTRKCPKNKA